MTCPIFCGTVTFTTARQRALSRVTWVQSRHFYSVSLTLHLLLCFHRHLYPQRKHLPSVFRLQFRINVLPSMRATCPAHFIVLEFVSVKIRDEEYEAPHWAVFSCFMYFRSRHLSEHPVVQHARSRFYRYARNLALGSYIQRVIPNVVTMWLTHLFRIREVPGSNLDPETFYPEWGKCQDRIQIRPGRFLPHPFHFITDQSFFHSTLYSLSYRKTSERCMFLVLSNW
jgi:hypothetical protein